MVDLFKVSDPSEALGNTITAREILDKGATRIRHELTDQPAIQATLMDTMGTVYTSLGLYDQAVPLMQQALLQAARRCSGPQHLDVAQSLNNLGEALTRTSDYTESETRPATGAGDPSQAAGQQQRRSSAHAVIAGGCAVVAGRIRAGAAADRGGAEDPHRACSATSIRWWPRASATWDRTTRTAASSSRPRHYQRQAVALQREIHAGPHPALAEAINNLAWTLMSVGRPADAEPLYRESLDMQRKLLGEAHPDLALALNNLGYARESRGDYRGAEAAYLEALKMNRKLLGERHPEVANMMSNLAFVMYAEGRRVEAMDEMRASLSMRRDLLGNDHPDVAGGAASLAYWLIDAKQYDEADLLVNESLAIRRKQLGPDNPTVAGSLTVRANLLLARRDFKRATEDATEAERIVVASLGAEHWQFAMASNAHGAALTGLGQYPEAERLLLGSLKGLDWRPHSTTFRQGAGAALHFIFTLGQARARRAIRAPLRGDIISCRGLWLYVTWKRDRVHELWSRSGPQ